MKKLLISMLLVCFIIPAAKATDTSSEKKKGTISGKVTDQESHPISFASVALLNAADSTLTTGVISDSIGIFSISGIEYGKYFLKISFIGYKPQTISDLEINRKNNVVETGPVRLKEDVTSLEEVKVTKERLKGEEKIDRTVFTLNDDVRKSSTNGLKLLRHIPSVSVDFQDNVTLEGSSNIQFYVDGVLRNKDYVAQLDPQYIDKVELLTNPGVKYDSDISGVINIVMKKEKRYGISGSLQAPLFHPNKIIMDPRANIEYGTRKVRVYAGDRLHFENFDAREYLTTTVDNSAKNDGYTNYKITNGRMTFANNYMNYGIDWFINDKTSLNFMGEWRNSSQPKDDVFTTNKKMQQDEITQYFETKSNTVNSTNNHYLSLFLKHTPEKEGSELTAEAYLYLQSSDVKNNYFDTYFDPANMTTVLGTQTRNNITYNNSNTARSKLDYTFVTGKVKHETGLRGSYLWMENKFSNQLKTDQADQLSNQLFSYNESRGAGYYNLSGKFGKFSWQAGLKGEYSNINIGDTTQIDYFEFLPQMTLSKSFENNQSVKLTYRRQLERPYVFNLNPFETWDDSLHYRTGNPNLKPSLEHQLELSYSKNFGNNYISPKIYANYVRNGIQDLTTVEQGGITHITQANIGKVLEYGTSVNSSVQLIKKWWRMNVYGRLYKREISSSQHLSVDDFNNKLSYGFSFTSIVTLPKDYSFYAIARYNSPSISYQRLSSRDMLYLIAFDKKFSDKASLEVVYNPFIKDFTYSQVETRSAGYNEKQKGVIDIQYLFEATFTYRFKYGGKVKKINREVNYENGGGGSAL
ncbi:MAG TPA: outer membrane beta-barrel family protein [Bacteroidales bacterium]|nr:outer membrane beta-barrel family protein [Bacteroidales bacterium]